MAVAKQNDADGDEVEHALHPTGEGLSPDHRLSILLADAVMTRPGDIDDATVAAIRERFTPEQIVEMTLKVLKFNVQKPLVALGTHAWIEPDAINEVSWNRDGTYVAAD